METYNEAFFPCPPPVAFRLAHRVDQWPRLLPHYRWVHFHRGTAATGGTVEMAAVRRFGRLAWPVWWLSEMRFDPDRLVVDYRHLGGITRGMTVRWQVESAGSGSRVMVTHHWPRGPRFAGPLGPAIGRQIVGPHFVHVIADQTLHHLARQARQEVAQ